MILILDLFYPNFKYQSLIWPNYFVKEKKNQTIEYLGLLTLRKKSYQTTPVTLQNYIYRVLYMNYIRNFTSNNKTNLIYNPSNWTWISSMNSSIHSSYPKKLCLSKRFPEIMQETCLIPSLQISQPQSTFSFREAYRFPTNFCTPKILQTTLPQEPNTTYSIFFIIPEEIRKCLLQ